MDTIYTVTAAPTATTQSPFLQYAKSTATKAPAIAPNEDSVLEKIAGNVIASD